MSHPTWNRSSRCMARPFMRWPLLSTPLSSLPLGLPRTRMLAGGSSGSQRFTPSSRSMTALLLVSLPTSLTGTSTFSTRTRPLLVKRSQHVYIATSSQHCAPPPCRGSSRRRVWPPDLSSSAVGFRLMSKNGSSAEALNCAATQCTSKSVPPNKIAWSF